MAGLKGGGSIAARAITPGTDQKVYLDLDLTVYGEGEAPEFDDEKQNWNFKRSYQGHLEVEVTSEVVGVPPDDRTMLVIRPKSGGVCTVVGEYSTISSLEYTDVVEGGLGMRYYAYEFVDKTQVMEAKDLIMQLTLDEASMQWGGELSLAGWESKLFTGQRYQGSGSYTPGPNGGWAEEWHHFTTDPRDRTRDGHTIKGGYVPVSTTSVEFSTAANATVNAGFYSARRDFPIPPDRPGGKWKMNASFGWTLRDRLPDVELIVRSSRYRKWAPYLPPNNGPGDPLHFVATVESPTGESLQRIRVKKYTWSLLQTSREPGLALNYPLEARDSEPDLRLAGWETKDEDQVSVHTPVDGDLSSNIEVVPYDWGGWSTLRVEAELEDGRTLQGHLRPTSELGGIDTDILIPWRRPESKVSEFWKILLGVSEMADSDDVETKPTGRPGADGDGFTVYEEYRGFYVNGVHEILDPELKDLFVLNQVGGRADRALKQFRQLSHLTIHEERGGQLQVLNLNRRDGPTLGRQHGILIRETSLAIRPNEGIRAGNRLRDRAPLRVTNKPYVFGDSRRANRMLDSMLLQGLFQMVGVDRPGADDRLRPFELQLVPEGSNAEPWFMLLPNTPVLILDFFGDDLAKKWAPAVRQGAARTAGSAPLELVADSEVGPYRAKLERDFSRFDLLVGEKGGAHSGQEDCVMRDWFADVYRTRFNDSQGRPIYRLIDPQRGPEQPGTVLGSTRRGTGVNAPDRVPEPRYGDSAVAAPANRQMIISDHLP